MKRLVTSALLATGTIFAAYLVEKRQTPFNFAQATTQKTQVKIGQYQTMTAQAKNAAHKLTALQNEFTQAQPTVAAMKQSIGRFQFKMAPRLATIEQTLDDLKTVIEND